MESGVLVGLRTCSVVPALTDPLFAGHGPVPPCPPKSASERSAAAASMIASSGVATLWLPRVLHFVRRARCAISDAKSPSLTPCRRNDNSYPGERHDFLNVIY